jgi:YD repeat-containing protein
MRLWKIVLAASVLAAVASVARAQTEVKYDYDVLGRLTKVEHLDGPNAGASATYTYDAADNRTEVVRVNPNPTPPPPATAQKVVVVPLFGLVVIPFSGI